MSAQRRAGSKRRGSASSRRSGTEGKVAVPTNGPAPERGGAVTATATANAGSPTAAPTLVPGRQSRLSMPGRGSRPPMPEAAKPSRPPMPEKPRPESEAKNPVTRRYSGLERWYQDTASEMRKIVWPDRETTKNLTIVVIGISVVLGILLGGIDYILQAIFEVLP
jgi:preprotein translocase subunit SecE